MENTLSQVHADWLANVRMIDPEVAVKAGVYSEEGQIGFPYSLRGTYRYTKFRNTSTKDGFRTAGPNAIQDFCWLVDSLAEEPSPSEPLIVVEGELDALAVLTAGFRYVVSIPSGAKDKGSNYDAALKFMADTVGQGENTQHYLRPEFRKFSKVVIATDTDLPGVLMRDALVEIFGKRKSFLPAYPAGMKDTNDVLVKHGVEGVRALIDDARIALPDNFVGVSLLAKQTKKPEIRPTHIACLEKHCRFSFPGMVVIGGNSGTGKSSVMRALIADLVWHNPDVKVAGYSWEGGAHSFDLDLRRFWNARNGDKLGKHGADAARDAWINDNFKLVKVPKSEKVNPEDVKDQMIVAAHVHKASIFLIDPFNWIDIRPTSRNELKTDAINTFIIDLYGLAEEMNMMVVIAQHTTPQKGARSDQPPRMEDLADSNHFHRRADHVIMMWRHEEADKFTQLNVAKCKRHDLNGVPGKVWISFDARTCSIVPVGNDPLAVKLERRKAEAQERKR